MPGGGYRGTQGRKPKASTISERLRGRDNDEAKLKRLPPAPAYLDDKARAEWKRLGRQLVEAGMLTKLDLSALALYCAAYARYVQAEEMLHGPVGYCPTCDPATEAQAPKCGGRLHLDTPYGAVIPNRLGARAPSPYLAISDKAWSQMVRVLAEFGLTPASRGRVPKESGRGDRRMPRRIVATGQGADPRAALGWPVQVGTS